MIKSLLLALILVLSNIMYAQNQFKIDSTWKVVENTLKNNDRQVDYKRLLETEDVRKRTDIIFDLGDRVLQHNPEEAYTYFYHTLIVYKELGHVYGEIAAKQRIANELIRQNKKKEAIKLLHDIVENTDVQYESYFPSVYNQLGQAYYSSYDYEKSLKAFAIGLPLARKHKNNENILSIFSNTAVIYDEQGNYTKAIEHYFRALEYAEEYKYLETVIDLSINISTCYFEMNDVHSAVEYGHRALNIIQDKNVKHVALREVICTGNLADFYLQKGDLDLARDFITRSLKGATLINDEEGIANALRVLGEIQAFREEYSKALKSYNKSLQICEEVGDIQGQIIANRGMAYMLIKLKNGKNALVHATKSLNMSVQLGSAKDVKEGYNLMSVLYDNKQMIDSSFYYFKKFIALRDSLYGKEKTQEILNIRSKYDVEKKEQEIANLAQQSSIQGLELQQSDLKLTIFGIALVVLLLAGFAIYMMGKQKQLALKQRAQNMEQNLLRTQLNPHFIFNAMSAIQDNMRQGDSNQASIYLAKFSKLMRQVLDNSRSEFICLDQEVMMLENYLSLQNLRHDRPFKYEIVVDKNIDQEEITIPPMFAQPFVENAIEHGIANMDNDAVVSVYFSLKEDYLLLEVSDNGLGIQESMKVKNEVHISHATKITKERIDLYQQMTNKQIAFNIENLAKGTQVTFNLPYQFL